jgi:hypothetical protein
MRSACCRAFRLLFKNLQGPVVFLLHIQSGQDILSSSDGNQASREHGESK